MKRPIGEEWNDRIYRGIGPHPYDPRALEVAVRVAALIQEARPGTVAEHVGSTAVPGLAGKNVVDFQITADPADVSAITETLLAMGFSRQRGPDPWPPERPMLEGTYRCDGAVFLIHCHVVPTNDPDALQMIGFRDRLLADSAARDAYEAAKRRIAAETTDVYQYTAAKSAFIRGLPVD